MFPDLSVGSSAPSNELLVVDDDADLVRGLAQILKLRGYSVYQATCGREAVELAMTVMDIRMPGLNGIEA